MVAISLYRGNLHRVPEVPRRWKSLSPKISLKEFKSLLLRRSSALSRHRFRPILNPNPNSVFKRPKSEPIEIVVKQEETVIKTEGDDVSPSNPINRFHQLPKVSHSLDGKPPEITHVLDELSETEKKKKIIEEKLEVLNAKKHDLVQVLKQILNAEEELKRRSSTRSPIPLQVDVTNDSGSLSRLNTPRLNSDGNLASETDDISHQITHSRQLVHPNSISPSSDSLHRRPVFIAVPHPRASLGGIGSPSRFAPLGHLTNLPTAISTSGTSYFMSSPSPAASGTSAFRDNRQPSPWN